MTLLFRHTNAAQSSTSLLDIMMLEPNPRRWSPDKKISDSLSETRRKNMQHWEFGCRVPALANISSESANTRDFVARHDRQIQTAKKYMRGFQWLHMRNRETSSSRGAHTRLWRALAGSTPHQSLLHRCETACVSNGCVLESGCGHLVGTASSQLRCSGSTSTLSIASWSWERHPLPQRHHRLVPPAHG